jgi:VWFA-related protein
VKGSKQPEVIPQVSLVVREDGEEQKVLSVRGIEAAPLSVAVLVQDDLTASVNNQLRDVADFVRRLPRNSRVFVGYLRTGSLEVRQKFTNDLERAAKALRPTVSFASAAPYNPYAEIADALKRFESLPAGRRAVLLVSDGVDISRGSDIATMTHSIDLDRSIREAQRYGVAVYSFYWPSVGTAASSQLIVSGGQGALLRLSQETGGRAFFQGTGAPVSFEPFLRDVTTAFAGQLALTYLSTHPNKGYHRIEITPGTPGIEINHPAGYTR